MFDRYSKDLCGGGQVHVMDRDKFDPIRTALNVLKAVYEAYPQQLEITSYADKLMGVPGLRERIKTEKVEGIIAGWQKDLAQFKKLRQKHLIYPEYSDSISSPAQIESAGDVFFRILRTYVLYHPSMSRGLG
jgi:uncharacterized protein YbbC (DUF1343 family)